MDERRAATRRTVMGGLAAGFAMPALGSARAQANWPTQPVRIIVPYPPGGSTDVLTRILAERLKDRIGGTWVIENRPGAGGNIGIEAVVRADDGHTLGSATVGHFAINQYLYARMSWDPDKDLQPLSMTWDMPNVAVVPAEHVPAKTLAEFVEWAKKRDGGVFYGSPGVGTSPHLSGALFMTRHGIKGTHVPFRGASATIPAMLKGDVQIAIDNLASYTSIIESGQMRALAVTAGSRWPTLPNVPTMAEAGVPAYEFAAWSGLYGPAGLPAPIVKTLHDEFVAALKGPDADRFFDTVGLEPDPGTPDQLREHQARQTELWGRIIEQTGLEKT